MTEDNFTFDIVIIGAGPVGMALAAGLANKWKAAGRDPSLIALIDAKTLDQAQQDPRTLALADVSRMRLMNLGFPDNAVPIHNIHVSEQGKLGRVWMTARELGRSALGWTVSYGDLIASLHPAVQACGVTLMRGVTVQGVKHCEDACEIALSTGQTLYALLHVDAEGGIYGQASERDKTIDYGQSAFISTLEAEPASDLAKGTIAYERFTPDGPLALLPRAADGSRFALVWCAAPELVKDRLGWDDATVLARLEAAMGGRVKLKRIGKRLSFPLGLNMRQQTTGFRYAAVGNAAQILHPVAGQGLNLGLRDMDALVRTLSPDSIEHTSAVIAKLDDYARLRQGDRQTIVQLTDWMARGFATPHTLISAGRQLALMSLELLPGARTAFANTMLFGWMRT